VVQFLGGSGVGGVGVETYKNGVDLGKVLGHQHVYHVDDLIDERHIRKPQASHVVVLGESHQEPECIILRHIHERQCCDESHSLAIPDFSIVD